MRSSIQRLRSEPRAAPSRSAARAAGRDRVLDLVVIGMLGAARQPAYCGAAEKLVLRIAERERRRAQTAPWTSASSYSTCYGDTGTPATRWFNPNNNLQIWGVVRQQQVRLRPARVSEHRISSRQTPDTPRSTRTVDSAWPAGNWGRTGGPRFPMSEIALRARQPRIRPRSATRVSRISNAACARASCRSVNSDTSLRRKTSLPVFSLSR